MELHIYSDESGVFDKNHNNFFVFAGVIFSDPNNIKDSEKSYQNTENKIKKKLALNNNFELKATMLNFNQKRKLLRSIKNNFNFVVLINQEEIYDRIFIDKKTKQRYLDYAYKIGIKKALLNLAKNKVIDLNNVDYLKIFCDEHTTATNAIHDLQTSIFREFKIGIEKFEYNLITPPLLPNLKNVNVAYLNSKSKILIRYADILANTTFNIYRSTKNFYNKNIFVIKLP